MTESKTNEPGIEAIMQVGLGFWASKTLLSAIEMEVFTELAGHAEDLNSLQGRLGLHPDRRMTFWMLWSRSVSCSGPTANIPILSPPRNFSISTSQLTSAAYLRWQIVGSIPSGEISLLRSAPANRRMKAKAAGPISLPLSMPIRKTSKGF